MRPYKILYTLFFILTVQTSFGQNKVQILYQSADSAFKQKDYKTFLILYQQLDSLRSAHPRVLYHLAAAYSLNNKLPEALRTLERLLPLNATLAMQQDSSFMNLWLYPDFQNILKDMSQAQQPVTNSQVFFTVPQRDLHLESIAYDSKTGFYYSGSVHQRKIVYFDKRFKCHDFSQEGDNGAYAILGIQIDTKRRLLWAVSAATAEMRGYKPEDEGKSMLLKYDLDTQKLLATYSISDEQTHFFGDLLLLPDGSPLISDSVTPALYKLDKEQNKLTEWLRLPARSLQGLCMDKKSQKLFLADYTREDLFVIDIPTKIIHTLVLPAGHSAKGTDGLYLWKNQLICVQNGVSPMRVCKLKLDKSQKKILGCQILERANIHFGEPTLGTLVGKKFVYIANSSWAAYKDGTLQTEQLKDIVFLILNLSAKAL